MIQFEYFNYKLKQNSATKIKQTVGAITPPDGYAFGVLSALTNLETVSSTLITGYNAVFIHTLNSQVPTESAVNAFVTDVASGKVDKTNVAYRLYGTDENGNQTTFPIGVNNLQDVQVDGVSVVDADGIANIDLTGYVRTDGTSVMTAPLLMRATDDFKCAIAPYWDGVGFFKLNDNNSVTLMASIEYNSGFEPATTNTYNIGALTRKWKNLYLSGKAYMSVINNGYDIAVPVTNSADTLALKSEVDLAANSGRMITDQGVWYAKMYAATVAPSAENGTNYADFSQTDGQGNPIIVIYERQNGAWVQDQTITPPAEYDGYVSITSKIWDITEQAGQQGGRVLWNHTSKEFTPYPQIISFENAALTGVSTAPTPTNSSPNDQIANKEYVDNKTSQQGYHPDLFDWKWADHELDDPSWLRADTFSWQLGSAYKPEYKHLYNDICLYTSWRNADANPQFVWTRQRFPSVGDDVFAEYGLTTKIGTVSNISSSIDDTATITVNGIDYVVNVSQSVGLSYETIAGVTIEFYLADDGHKICLMPEESVVEAIYNATGVAWYYILDTTNQRFKLPRSKHNKYTTELGVIGTGKTLGLTDGTNNYGLCNGSTYARVTVGTGYYGSSVSASGGENTGTSANRTLGVTTDSTKSGVKTTTIAQDTDQYKYLYFYVGQFTQTALENTAGLNAELFNGKADLNLANVLANIDFVVESQEATAENNYTWYRKYRSGRVEQGGLATIPSRTNSGGSSVSVVFPVTMTDTNYTGQLSFQNGGAYYANCALTFKNRQTTGVDLESYMNASGTTAAFLVGWQVSGKAAN